MVPRVCITPSQWSSIVRGWLYTWFVTKVVQEETLGLRWFGFHSGQVQSHAQGLVLVGECDYRHHRCHHRGM